MAKICTNCGDTDKNGRIIMTEWAYEAKEARHEREKKRLWIVCIILIGALLLSNIAWLIYESQFETYYYEQDGEGLNNINNGEQGDVINEPTVESQEEEENGEKG